MLKYSLERLELIPYLNNDNKVFVQELKKQGIIIPFELIGNSLSNSKTKEIIIYYPLGDLFASIATAIHEIGHLRLNEFDSRYEVKITINNKQETQYQLVNPHLIEEIENCAWLIGWKRFINYAPDFWESIEEEFQRFVNIGKLTRFLNFEQFYMHWYWMNFEHLNKKILPIKIHTYPEDPEIITEIANVIKNDKALLEFLHKPFYWQTDELVEQEFIEQLIRTIVVKVSQEKY